MSRKPHEPTDKDRKQVTMMCGLGLTHDQIARIVGVSDETLRKYYRDELDTGEARANAQVAQNLFTIATSRDSGSVAAAIFWMKTRGKWRETNHTEITGPGGGAIQVESKTVDAKELTPEERAALRQAMLTAKAKTK